MAQVIIQQLVSMAVEQPQDEAGVLADVILALVFGALRPQRLLDQEPPTPRVHPEHSGGR